MTAPIFRRLTRALMFLFVAAAPAMAQVPTSLTVQGRLLDAAGAPLPDGTYDVTFTFYDTGGAAVEGVYSEKASVAVVDGVFTHLITETICNPCSFPMGTGIRIGSGPEGDLIPIASVPQAVTAAGVHGTVNVFPSEGPVRVGNGGVWPETPAEMNVLGRLLVTDVPEDTAPTQLLARDPETGVITHASLDYLSSVGIAGPPGPAALPEIQDEVLVLYNAAGDSVFAVFPTGAMRISSPGADPGQKAFFRVWRDEPATGQAEDARHNLQLGSSLAPTLFVSEELARFAVPFVVAGHPLLVTDAEGRDLLSVGDGKPGVRVGTRSNPLFEADAGGVTVNPLFEARSGAAAGGSFYVSKKGYDYYQARFFEIRDDDSDGDTVDPVLVFGEPTAPLLTSGALGTSVGTPLDVTGDLTVRGNLSASGTKNFRIDHPLDPDGRWLQHAAIESDRPANLYDGTVVLDGSGEATVTLPAWFEALNTDYRYQLTAVGAPAPGLYVASEITDGRFRIAGGPPGLKVSWQVTGVRQDRYMQEHPFQVELPKSSPESR